MPRCAGQPINRLPVGQPCPPRLLKKWLPVLIWAHPAHTQPAASTLHDVTTVVGPISHAYLRGRGWRYGLIPLRTGNHNSYVRLNSAGLGRNGFEQTKSQQ